MPTKNQVPCDCCGEPLPRHALRGLSRRGLLFGGAGLVGAGLIGGGLTVPARAQSSYSGKPARGEFVIRKGSVLTVDDDLGNLAGADIHVRAGVIEAIGYDLVVPEGTEEIDASRMIVMPGMIETHWHIWNSLMRNFLSPGVEYFPLKNAFVPHMAPDSFYASDMLAFAEAIDAGITTIHNFDHNCRSRETVEAEMRAHLDSGVRALFTFGRYEGMPNSEMINLDLMAAIQSEWFGASSPFEGLVEFGFNTRNHTGIGEAMYRTEMDWAFSRGLMTAMHGGQSNRNVAMRTLYDWGYLGPKLICVHMVHADAEDRALMAETGASLSYSIQSEFRLGNRGFQAEQLVHMFNDGVNVSLSFDANTLGQIDMLENIAAAWYVGIPYGGTSTEGLQPVQFADAIRMGTINGAKALGIADRTGSLTVGKRADIVLLRADDVNLIPAGFVESTVGRSARARNVDTVIIDGRIMKRGGVIVGIDLDQVREDVARVTYETRVKMGGIYTPVSDVVPSF